MQEEPSREARATPLPCRVRRIRIRIRARVRDRVLLVAGCWLLFTCFAALRKVPATLCIVNISPSRHLCYCGSARPYIHLWPLPVCVRALQALSHC